MTILDLAALVDHLRAVDDASVSPPSGPVFLAPGAGGDSPLLARFRAACGPEVDFVTLAYPDWREIATQGIDARGFVKAVVDQVTATSPEGPVRLAGFSVGARVAHAAARQLAAAGRTIDYLGLIDGEAVSGARRSRYPASLVSRVRRFTERAGIERDVIGRSVRILVEHQLRSTEPRLLRALATSRWVASRGHALRRQLALETHRQLVGAPDMVGQGFEAPATRVVLYCSGGEGDGEDLGWSAVHANLTIRVMGGEHLTMMAPPILDRLARAFVVDAGQAAIRRSGSS
jgi:thioesterase domain-containing protein